MSPHALRELGTLDRAAFVARLGGVYEHSPWVAERAWARRPFSSVEALHGAMEAVVAAASRDEQLALIRAHPELLGKLEAAQLTHASRAEQAAAGLDRCTETQRARMRSLNAAYREKFGFPFIVAVRGLDWAGIIERIEARLPNDAAAEVAQALAQIARITRLRLDALEGPGDDAAFVRGLPKAELHMHIEGSLEPEMMFALARKHGVPLAYDSVEALRAAYDFADLQSFLDLYYAGAAVLRDAEDFEALAWAYARRAAGEGVVHAEVFFDPQTHTARGVAYDTVLDGLRRGLERGRSELGLSYSLILCFLRHLDEASALATLREALPRKHDIHGVGLDSSERGHPPSKFVRVFALAREEGLPAVAHAGEEGPADYIREALDLLHVRRIDHGVRIEEDEALLERVRAAGIPLTVCPLSNVRLRVFARLEDHNLKRLLDRGLCVTVNSDDPAYFGGYVEENLLQSQRALALSREDLVRLARNSFIASFLPEPQKAHWIARVDSYALSQG